MEEEQATQEILWTSRTVFLDKGAGQAGYRRCSPGSAAHEQEGTDQGMMAEGSLSTAASEVAALGIFKEKENLLLLEKQGLP